MSPLGHTIHHFARWTAQLCVNEMADVHNLKIMRRTRVRAAAAEKKVDVAKRKAARAEKKVAVAKREAARARAG